MFEEYGIVFQDVNKKSYEEFYKLKGNQVENKIEEAIRGDDIMLFIEITEWNGFDKDMRIHYLNRSRVSFSTLLELCCLYGSVRCFKFLRSKFNSEITEKCLNYSFLSRIPGILMKKQ